MKQQQTIPSHVMKRLVTTTETFTFSDEERKAIEDEKHYYENDRAIIISALKIIQKNRGWVSDEAILAIAQMLGISISDVEGVATFYSQIFRKPVGRHIIRYCDSVVCYINGYQRIKNAIEHFIHIKPGETTLDNRFTFLPISCLGHCDKGPIVMIDDSIYVNLTSESIIPLLEQFT